MSRQNAQYGPNPQHGQSATKVPMNGETISILLLDKNHETLPLIQEALAQARTIQATLVHTVDISEALRYLDEQRTDVLVFDLSLLCLHGFELLIQIRDSARTIPVIALTDSQSETLLSRAFEIGLQGYLAKDRIDTILLVWTLRYAMERHMRMTAQEHIKELQISESRFLRVINRNADGILVVDPHGIVQLINPAAEQLLGRRSGEVLGEDFGFPMVVGETTELDIIRPGYDLAVAEMRVVEIEWNDTIAYLTSLRDITDHRRMEQALRESEQFSRAILNSILAHIIVLDQQGRVTAVNEAWVNFVTQHAPDDSLTRSILAGTDFFDVCRRTSRLYGPETTRVLDGIRSVIRGETDIFRLEYRLCATVEPQWFVIRAVPLTGGKHRGVVVSHTDITDRKQAEQVTAEAEVHKMRVIQLERELQALLHMSHSGTTTSTVTSSLFGALPLHQSSPDLFEGLVQRYTKLIDMALEQRAYKVEYNLSDELRAMADQLGFLRAGPRDVVEIHSRVLQQKSSEAINPLKDQVYLEEGRLMLIELMGYLVSYYRSFAQGTSSRIEQ